MFKTMMGCLNPKSKPASDDIKKIPPFIFCRWLSGNPSTILAANQLNLYDKIPIVNQYDMIKSVFAGKVKYIPYPKSVKEDATKYLQYLSEHFNVSLDKAEDYMEFISKEELKEIVDMYTAHELKK